MAETQAVEQDDLVAELERLEEKVLEISLAVQRLREEKRDLERICEGLRRERQLLVGRLSSLIEKVDALRGEV